MRAHSLVAFTLLGQTAVGAYACLCLLFGWPGHPQAGGDGGPAWAVVAGLIMLGIAFSLLHLGSPGRAFRAAANWRSSWLSREILFALLFAGAALFFTWLPPARVPWTGSMAGAEAGSLLDRQELSVLRSAVAGAGLLFGAGLLWSMAGAYRLRTVPGWNNWMTPVSFLATTLLLGGLTAGALLTLPPLLPGAPAWPLRGLRALALACALLSLGQPVALSLWLRRMRDGSETQRQTATRITRGRRHLLRLRSALALGCAAVCLAAVLPIFRVPGPPGTLVLSLAFSAAFLLAAAAETAGRILFYDAGRRVGL